MRQIINTEKPDAIIHFTDPRYWVWMYQMENEIRQQCPLVFYTIWDDLPYPMWNRNFYRSDDMLLGISKQSTNIVKNVLRDHSKEDWAVKYVPHGIEPKKFFPIINYFRGATKLIRKIIVWYFNYFFHKILLFYYTL